MPRVVEILLPASEAEAVIQALDEHEDIEAQDAWSDVLSEDRALVRVLVPQADVEPIIDLVEARWGEADPMRIIVLDVETALPRPEDEEEEEPQPGAEEEPSTPFFPRISRDEIYDTVVSMAELDGHFLSFVVLATIVAAIGLIRNNVAVIIGSMVIAPLIGPVVCLCLATVLADRELAQLAMRSNAVGIGITLAASFLMGLVIPVDPTTPQIATRFDVSLWDVGLGLAVGAAGSLSFTTGLSTALVGVMVAVALLPPMVAAGLLLGASYYTLAGLAGLQGFVYLISINLSGVAIFALQGIRPANWWEEDQARRATYLAIVLWTGLLAILAAIVWYTGAIELPGELA